MIARDPDWAGPVPLEGIEQPSCGQWLFYDPDGDLAAPGSFFVAWQPGVAQWGNGEVLQGEAWALHPEEALQFGWMLVRLAGRAGSYPVDELTGDWAADWAGPQPIEYGHYPLPSDSLEWNDQRQGMLVGWLFCDVAGDLFTPGEFFIAVSPGVERWDNGQILHAGPETLIWPLGEAEQFGHGLAQLAERTDVYQDQLVLAADHGEEQLDDEFYDGEESPELPPLEIGAIVRVFRSSESSPLWFYDPQTGQCTTQYSLDVFEVGRVREARGESYRVTVTRKGREFFINWMSRHWIRMPHEPTP